MGFVLSTIISPCMKLVVRTCDTLSPEVLVARLDPVVDEATGQ
jgi:hypothetical protein